MADGIQNEIKKEAVQTADEIMAEGAGHIKHFVEKNLPALIGKGYDFVDSLESKLKAWLAKVDAHQTKDP